jgi:hypothetical protein
MRGVFAEEELEDVTEQDEDTGAGPVLQGQRQFPGRLPGCGGRRAGEVHVAHHQRPATERDLDVEVVTHLGDVEPNCHLHLQSRQTLDTSLKG